MAARPRICLAALTVVLLAGLTAILVIAQNVKARATPGQDFPKFRTYGWKENMIGPKAFPEEREAAERKIREIVNRELSKKGYSEVPENPNFFVEVRTAIWCTPLRPKPFSKASLSG